MSFSSIPLRITKVVMQPQPLYDPRAVNGAFQLRFAWSAWASSEVRSALIDETAPCWESDGLRVLEQQSSQDLVQILFSTLPSVSPLQIAQRAKGRLDHACRLAKVPIDFSRKVAIRSVGDATRRDLEEYLSRQVAKERLADDDFAAKLQRVAFHNDRAGLSEATESARGRYWYNLHLVLCVEGRSRVNDVKTLETIRDGCVRVAEKKGHSLGQVSAMPDHLHAILRANINEAPVDVVFAYQNNLAHMLRQRLWADTYFVGTFGEYSTKACAK